MKNDDLQEYIDQRRADPHFQWAWDESQLEYMVTRQLIAWRRAIKTLVLGSWRNW